jgi:hypothetical protein
MKKILLFLLLAHLITLGQNQNTIQNDSIKKEKKIFGKKIRENTQLDALAKEMGSTFHNTSNTDFGSSKYDKDINWSTDIDENNVQRSLDRYREGRRETDFKNYSYIILKILFIIFIIIVILSTFLKKSKRY